MNILGVGGSIVDKSDNLTLAKFSRIWIGLFQGKWKGYNLLKNKLEFTA